MGRSVVVTGANSGIGLVTCLELAGAGYDVIGTVRSADKARAVLDAAAQRGVQVRTVELEVDDEASCARAVQEVAEMTGGQGPWALVNNAGYAQAGTVEDVPDAQARAQLETNVVAPARLARLFLPGMRERGDGRIINISSVAGRLSAPLMGWYCASKHALEALTDALRMEVAADGVKVVLVEPGMIGTPIWSDVQSQSLPTPATPRYATAYARADALASRSAVLPHPVWVARAVRVALAHPAPRARYVVGVDAVAGLVAETLAPTRFTDWVKTVSTGLRGLPRPLRR